MAIDRNTPRQQVFEFLITRALLRTNCTYEDIARAVPTLTPLSGPALAAAISPILLEILTWCEVRHIPKLTALVVRRKGATHGGLPGHGFWEQFGITMRDTAKSTLWALSKQWQRETYNYWQSVKDNPIPLLDTEVSMDQSQHSVSLAHCEIRKVPADWVHPVDDDGRQIGLRNNYQRAHKAYTEDLYQWNELGMINVGGNYEPIPDNLKSLTGVEYYGQAPQMDLFMPDWAPAEATSVQLYERRTGCPVSPVLSTNAELLKWFFTKSMTPAKVEGVHA